MLKSHLLRLTAAFVAAAFSCSVLADTPAPVVKRTLSWYRAKMPYPVLVTMIDHKEGSTELLLFGGLNAGLAANVKSYTDNHPAITTLLVDLIGGDSDAAMDLAQVVADRKLRVVVDGRCLSVCADYLLAAAPVKTVLPGSVVALQSPALTYVAGGQRTEVFEPQVEAYLKKIGDTATLASWEKSMARRAQFFQSHAIDTRLHDSFIRTGAQKAGANGCPASQMWALDQKQLESIGIKGIDKFWFPKAGARAALARTLSLPAGSLYYGEQAGMEKLCLKQG